jgi:hypothetical protein
MVVRPRPAAMMLRSALTIMKFLLFPLAAVGAWTAGTAHSAIVNGSFEQPTVPPGQYNPDLTSVPGWSTTASNNKIEIWNNYQGISAYEGSQFTEVNAWGNTAIYQDVTITTAGLLSVEFAHRGRSGTDTLQMSVIYAGLDGVFDSADDQTVFSDDYATGTAWNLYPETDVVTTVAGGQYRFEFQAIATSNNVAGAGNFLDAVSYTVSPIPEPSGAALLLGSLGLLAWRRKR